MSQEGSKKKKNQHVYIGIRAFSVLKITSFQCMLLAGVVLLRLWNVLWFFTVFVGGGAPRVPLQKETFSM